MTVIVKPSPTPVVRVVKTESGVVKVIRQVTSLVKVVTAGPQGIQGPAGTTSWNGLVDKPSTFTPSAHTHPTSEITGFTAAASAAAPVQSVAGKSGNVTLVKADVGLANVDNTSDANKPVSTAQQSALDLKANASDLTSHTGNTSNPHQVTKSQVGLGNVDNTSDANKPVSTAQASADTAVANAAAADATTKANAAQAHAVQRANHTGTQPISTIDNLQTSLDGKSATGHGHAISDVTGLQTALDNKQASGSYATLENGLVPSSQLPSYVDDVLEYSNLAGFPVSGDSGKIYVALDTTKIYRWSGSTYVEISPSPGSTDAVPEGSTNKYFTTQRAADAAPVQSVAGKVGAVTLAKGDVGLGNVDNTSDANKPVSTATQTALDGKVSTSDSRLTDSREWSASTVTQSEAEAGIATTRVAWTVQRVWQAIAAWWAVSSAKTKLDGITSGATANQTDAYLLSRANHTGTQAASTITGLASVATSGSYNDLTNKATVIQFAASDETTAITTGTAKITFRMPYAMTLTEVRASLGTAQASGNIFTVNIKESGTTIFSTKLTIDNTEKTSTTAATAAVLSDTSLADDAEITLDIDQVGNGTAKGLKITMIGTRA